MIPVDEIRSARRRIAPFVVETPIATSRAISEELGVETLLKLEMFQKSGSFKPRGAANQLLALDDSQRDAGVVGISGGNFAQGLAYAAGKVGVRAKVIMPRDTPDNYLEATRSYGADIELAADIAAAFERYEEHVSGGWAPMHPFDAPAMMAGNGTLGLELIEQVPDLTDVMISVGGGGFMAGVTSAIKSVRPEIRVWGVETEGADVMARSVAAGSPQRMVPTSIAKTLGSPYAGQKSYEIAVDHLEDVVVVSDKSTIEAMAFLLERAKLIAEPAAACTLAAARTVAGSLDPRGRLVLVLCGGNISIGDICRFRSEFGI